MNIQFAIQSGVIYILEVNPRASRTVPFVSKATGIPLAKVAARVMTGKTLSQQGRTVERIPPYFSVKEAVFPFIKFPEADPVGAGNEIDGRGDGNGQHLWRGLCQSPGRLRGDPADPGTLFHSVRDRDKPGAVILAQMLMARGFEIAATGAPPRCSRRPVSPAGESIRCVRVARMWSI